MPKYVLPQTHTFSELCSQLQECGLWGGYHNSLVLRSLCNSQLSFQGSLIYYLEIWQGSRALMVLPLQVLSPYKVPSIPHDSALVSAYWSVCYDTLSAHRSASILAKGACLRHWTPLCKHEPNGIFDCSHWWHTSCVSRVAIQRWLLVTLLQWTLQEVQMENNLYDSLPPVPSPRHSEGIPQTSNVTIDNKACHDCLGPIHQTISPEHTCLLLLLPWW